MSAAPGRPQASSHRSAQHEGIPVLAAPGRPQASSQRSAQHEGIPVLAAPGHPQASSHRSAQHEGIPVFAAPGRPQASSHRSAQHEGTPVSPPVLLSARQAGKAFVHQGQPRWACRDVSFDLYPGEVLAVVGESGSGKSTLLRLLAARHACDEGSVHYDVRAESASEAAGLIDLAALSEARLRWLARTDWGFVEQHARDGLRMNVSGGANVGERLMALGARHYGHLRSEASSWMQRVELDTGRIDDLPATYSGGMQQRLQIARNLVTHPRLVFMDEPTTGLDVSVQARLLDLLRELVDELQLAAVVVTHDLAVARLLAQRMLVMKDGQVVEQGLTDRVLDDPQHPYTQLLVSSVLTP